MPSARGHLFRTGIIRDRLRIAGRAARGPYRAITAFAGVGVPIIGLLLALGVIGPLRGDRDAVAAAVENARDAGSAFVDVQREFRNSNGKIFSRSHGEGMFSFRGLGGVLDIRNAGASYNQEPQLRYIFRGQTIYVFGYGSRKNRWCQYHLLSSGRVFGALTGFSDDPSQALSNLREHGHAEKVGEEELLGAKTTHYTGEIDLRAVQTDATTSVRERVREFMSISVSKLPVDLWLDEDDLVRRIRTTFTLPGEAFGGATGLVQATVSIDFSQYGLEVRPELPPVKDVSFAGDDGCPAELA